VERIGTGAGKSRWIIGARILAGVALICYPLLVWLGLTRESPRALALVLLCIVGPVATIRLWRADRAAMRGLAALPLVTAAGLVLAALLDTAGFMLVVPVAINCVLLIAFAMTLGPGSTPMIERFARLQVRQPTPGQQAWCRLWTWIWCGFFVLNGGTALWLALSAPLSWWAFYNGLVAYILMGVLFASEWVMRRRRFAKVIRSDDPDHSLDPTPLHHPPR